ncbi:hypothetical protein [Variovorax sp. LT1R16]|uniref:hypothetical protein n=1 Tax=Variovorax sp. LT1R16 TaxID=3443728 RepID=UPI003F45CB1A
MPVAGACHRLHADRAAGASPVVHDNLRVPSLCQVVGDDAGHGIDRAPGGKGYDDADRLLREGRSCGMGRNQDAQGQGQGGGAQDAGNGLHHRVFYSLFWRFLDGGTGLVD